MDPRGVLVLFLVLAAVIVSVFAFVGLGSRRGPAEVHAPGRLRGAFFGILTAALAVALLVTLPRLPYPAPAGPPAQVVHVAGKQFAFALSSVPITTEDDWRAAAAGDSVEVSQGELVEFRVTSLDVNHGFSLYDPDGVLVTQTQAMPGYVNRLRVRFDRTGRYTALCLEYCGMGHHLMKAVVDVR